MRRPVLAFCLASLLLLAGCAGKPSAAGGPSSASPSQAPSVEPDDETGTIEGVVTDEEGLPLRARANLIEGSLEVETDAGGAFAFGGLAPGSYRLHVAALGFQEQARRVEVKAGEATQARFTLVAVPLVAEAYTYSTPRTSLLNADNGLVSGSLRFIVPVNTSVVTDLFCNTCLHSIHFPPKPVALRSEVVWASSPTPYVNQEIELWYWWKEGTLTGISEWEFMLLSNREGHGWTAANVQRLAEQKRSQFVLEVTAAEIGASVQHRVEAWTSLAYGDEFPDDFTALPPG